MITNSGERDSMNTLVSTALNTGRTSVIKNRAAKASTVITVRCGSVTVKVAPPSRTEVKRNIMAGQEALFRAKNAFLKPGVSIHPGKDVPFFSVDPSNTSILVRMLNGKRDLGILKNGVFEVCK